MPEGDSIRRLATRVAERYVGQRVVASNFRHPRLATADLTGASLVGTDAQGKHLLCRFDNGTTLHCHLLMQGRVVLGSASNVPEWRRRFEIRFESGHMVGVDIPILHVIASSREEHYVGHLGPNLCGDYDHQAAIARLSCAAARPLAATLLDQRIVAGFGNIYAVETPFICGVSPHIPVEDLTDVEPVLAVGAALIRTNAARGPQNTTGRHLDRSEHWVLSGRVRNCKLCGTRIRRLSEASSPWGRRTAWCPKCQPSTARSVDLSRVSTLLALHPARHVLDFTTTGGGLVWKGDDRPPSDGVTGEERGPVDVDVGGTR